MMLYWKVLSSSLMMMTYILSPSPMTLQQPHISSRRMSNVPNDPSPSIYGLDLDCKEGSSTNRLFQLYPKKLQCIGLDSSMECIERATIRYPTHSFYHTDQFPITPSRQRSFFSVVGVSARSARLRDQFHEISSILRDEGDLWIYQSPSERISLPSHILDTFQFQGILVPYPNTLYSMWKKNE